MVDSPVEGVDRIYTQHPFPFASELSALYDPDHTQTLGIILPSVMPAMGEQKSEKLLQYTDQVWNLSNAKESVKIDLAIEKT